jgi:hypothetical protein
MYCTKCGELNPDDANFCKKCGAPIAKQGETNTSAAAKPQPPAEPAALTPQVAINPSSSTLQPPAAQTQPAAPPANSGLSIASLVLGIVGLVPYLQICSILAIIFGAMGINQANKKGYGGKSMALTGLILGIVGIVVGIAVIALVIAFSVYGYGLTNM